MDTKLASSPNYFTAHSPIVPRIFAATLSLGAVAWVIAASNGIAAAQTPDTESTARVTYADLDLSTESGAHALLQRIDVAAETACGAQVHSPLMPRESAEHFKCVVSAKDAAISRIDAPLVAQLNKAAPSEGGLTLAAR